MYDKTVRRRRLVLALLVALSLILVTAYFGEPGGGPLHSVQRGFFAVLAPIQDGASKALKPVRDLFSSVHDAFTAQGTVTKDQAEIRMLRKELIDAQIAAGKAPELEKLYNIDTRPALDIAQYGPVNAEVVGSSGTLWYSTVNINAGTSSGVEPDDPVIDGDGVVGKVTIATSDAAQVQLITDQTSGVAAQIAGTDYQGIIAPKQGDPNNLVLSFVQPAGTITVQSPYQYVVTAGTVSHTDPSLFPPGLPIGLVTSVNAQDVPETINVQPLADVRALDVVQVLTRGTRGVPNTVAIAEDALDLPPAGTEPPSNLAPLGGTAIASASAGGGG